MPAPQSASHCGLHGNLCAVIEHHLWPEPTSGTRQEAVKAALKGARDKSRYAINSRENTATGLSQSEGLTWMLECWNAVNQLGPTDQKIIELYFYTESGRSDDGKPCQAKDIEVGQQLKPADGGPLSGYEVGRRRRAAVNFICNRVWPYEPPGEEAPGD